MLMAATSRADRASRRQAAARRASALFRGASRPTRVALLLLLERGERHAGALGEAFGLSHSAVCQHLDVLLRAEVVARRRRGQRRYYRLTAAGRVLAELARRLGEWRTLEHPVASFDRGEVGEAVFDLGSVTSVEKAPGPGDHAAGPASGWGTDGWPGPWPRGTVALLPLPRPPDDI